MIIHCQTHCEYSRGLFPCFMFGCCKHLDTGKQIDKIKSNRFTITMDFQKLPFQGAIFFKTVCFILAEVFDKDDLHIAYKEQSFVARKDWEKREKLLVLDLVHPCPCQPSPSVRIYARNSEWIMRDPAAPPLLSLNLTTCSFCDAAVT